MSAKKTAQKRKTMNPVRLSSGKPLARTAGKKLLSPAKRVIDWKKSLQPNTPHRSFRRTYQRDYVRSFALPGYIPFTAHVWGILWKFKRTFVVLVLIYAVLSGVLVGLASQTNYSQLGDVLRSTSGEVLEGGTSQLEEAGLLLLAGLSGAFNNQLGEVEQIMAGILGILIWLVTIWMLRALLAGHRPSARDGFYNAGAPIVPTVLLSLFALLQLVPAILAMLAVYAALATGFVTDGAEAMLFWTAMMLLVVLSLYWVTSTVIALVIVTLPGMYPMRALKNAHEIVAGRRLRVVLRLLWLALVTALAWALVMIPIIIFDAWIKDMLPSIEWLPIMPVAWLLAGSVSIIWVASYVYILYRKMVDDDTTA